MNKFNVKKRIKAINEALVAGEISGEAFHFDNEKFKLKMRKKLQERTPTKSKFDAEVDL